MSYRRKHIKSKIHKIKPKKSILKRPLFWIVLLFLIIVLSASYFFLFYPGIQVKDIIISGNQKVPTLDIENLISDNINNKILGFVSSKSIFLVNPDKLRNEILDKFPIIESAKVDRKFMQTLELQIYERVPVAVFCPSLDESIGPENGNCYFIDDKGIVFEPVDVAPQDMAIVRQDMNNTQISVGEKAVQQNIIDLILKVGKNLKDNFQMSIQTADIINSSRLNIKTNENWQIYFDLSPDSDANLQITKLNLLLGEGISQDSRKNLRYIDLRPKDRAIVCDNVECGP